MGYTRIWFLLRRGIIITKNITLSNVKGRYSIVRSNDYVVLSGKNIYIFSVDGAFVARNNDLGNIRKVAFLPDSCILVDCGTQNSYIVLSLEDGRELWRIPRPRLDYSSNHFALSPDYVYVYDYCYVKETPMLVTIDLCHRQVHTKAIRSELRGLSDLICDKDGFPCLLQHHYDTFSGKRVSANGIRCEPKENTALEEQVFWKHRWFFDFPQISCLFLGNADTILTNDIYVFEPHSKSTYCLLENMPNWNPPGNRPSNCSIDEKKQYITLSYKNMDIVVDWIGRRIIAQYFTPLGSGCLIDNEYWISSDAGIRRMPFPFMETIPAAKPSFWTSLGIVPSK